MEPLAEHAQVSSSQPDQLSASCPTRPCPTRSYQAVLPGYVPACPPPKNREQLTSAARNGRHDAADHDVQVSARQADTMGKGSKGLDRAAGGGGEGCGAVGEHGREEGRWMVSGKARRQGGWRTVTGRPARLQPQPPPRSLPLKPCGAASRAASCHSEHHPPASDASFTACSAASRRLRSPAVIWACREEQRICTGQCNVSNATQQQWLT